MTSDAYRNVLKMVRELSAEEQLELIEDIITVARHRVQTKRKHSIMELRGLGKEIWEGIDVDQYINDERNSWDR